jgi:hypothetical protein
MGPDDARNRVAEEVERAEISLLPGDIFLGQTRVHVQPDATILTPSTYVLVEAKRIRRSAFQADQFAREFVAVLQEAEDRIPLLLLVLGAPPPVQVRGFAERIEVLSAISQRLADVASREDRGLTDEELVGRVPEVAAWITWAEIREIVIRGRDQLQSGANAPVHYGGSATRPSPRSTGTHDAECAASKVRHFAAFRRPAERLSCRVEGGPQVA